MELISESRNESESNSDVFLSLSLIRAEDSFDLNSRWIEFAQVLVMAILIDASLPRKYSPENLTLVPSNC